MESPALGRKRRFMPKKKGFGPRKTVGATNFVRETQCGNERTMENVLEIMQYGANTIKMGKSRIKCPCQPAMIFSGCSDRKLFAK